MELSAEPWVLVLAVKPLKMESTAELQALVMTAGSLVGCWGCILFCSTVVVNKLTIFPCCVTSCVRVLL